MSPWPVIAVVWVMFFFIHYVCWKLIAWIYSPYFKELWNQETWGGFIYMLFWWPPYLNKAFGIWGTIFVITLVFALVLTFPEYALKPAEEEEKQT